MGRRFEPHSHTHYSNIRLIDCINKPKNLIDRAIELGLSGIAITDHECLCAAVEIKEYQEQIDKDFKIAIGNEIYLTDIREPKTKYYHFILIAKDKVGFQMLKELSSYSWMNSYMDRGLERVPTLKSELQEKIKKFGKGHLIATSACIGSELGQTILALTEAEKNNNTELAQEKKLQIHNYITFCIECFGDDFYVECAPGCSTEQIIVNKRLKQIARTYNRKMVIGCDAHFLKKEDRYVHKAYLNSKQGEREVDSFYEYSYLQTEEELIEHLSASGLDYEEMVKNSEEIYDKVEQYSIFHKQQIPRVEVPFSPKFDDKSLVKYPNLYNMRKSENNHERYWVNECLKKLKELGKDNNIYLSRLEEEAEVKAYIGKELDSNMFDYPITLQHYIDLIWECGSTVGAGRGSSCSGLNHYLLGVTQLDPIEHDLPFFRYLNKDRVELPDIDIDVCPSKRPLILQKIREERSKNFNNDLDDLSKENLGCTLVATFGTESTKSAILTSCRGYRSEDFPQGIDVDEAQYLSSLVPVERGFIWSLQDVVYGNKEKGRKPVKVFIEEVEQYPGLLDIMFGIENLIKQRGSHASGVIFFDENPYEFGAFMKTPSGDIITQWDLHQCEHLGMTKFDILVTDVQDKIVETINLLQEYGEIDKDLTLKEVYDKYLHPNVLNLNDERIWNALEKGSVLNTFQFDSSVGARAAAKIKPRTIEEMSDCNGLMRLMTSSPGEEQPMDKYVRFKNNIDLWYKEMDNFGLTKEEEKTLEPYFKSSYGVPPSQEQLMLMLMDENICGFTLGEANRARKIVGKKQMDKIPALRQKVLAQAKSHKLGEYIWRAGVGPQMGYSFSKIHSLAYSFVGVQTLYLGTNYNPIFWNTACLRVNSGALTGGSTNYGKIAKALGDIQAAGIKIGLVDINKSQRTFSPNIEDNVIMFGLNGILDVGENVVEEILKNRPYVSPKDFYSKVKLNKTAMISLIKAGAFDQFYDRKFVMAWFIWETCEKKKRLTLQNFAGLVKSGMIPEELNFEKRVFEFNRYLRAICKNGHLDNRAIDFLTSIDLEFLIEPDKTLDLKKWDKYYQGYMDPARDWLKENSQEILQSLNEKIFMESWNKYAKGSISSWEMEVLCFYYHEHELINVNKEKYGLSNFFDLPEEQEVERSFFTKNGRKINIFKLHKIYGTCIAKNKSHSSITLLTPKGVVEVKFRKEHFALFDKRISALGEDGKKHIIEKSWFDRGSLIVIQGIKTEDSFMAKKYKRKDDEENHQLYRITSISDDGKDISLTSARAQGAWEE